MKIGIITFHDTINFGAAIQTYALQQKLFELGYDCEIINYTNKKRINSYSIKNLLLNSIKKQNIKEFFKIIAGSIFILRRKRNFNKFYQEYLSLSNNKYVGNQDIRNNPPNYDYYIAGSDQIWNYKNNGEDTTYFLDFVYDEKKTLSYASSFGMEEVPASLVHFYKKQLSSINIVSVREQLGADLYKEMTDKIAEVVLDPTLLFDREYWVKFCQKTKKNRPYILIYVTKTKTDIIDDFLNNMEIQIGNYDLIFVGTAIKIKYFINKRIKIKSGIGPREFLGLLNNADLIVTSSFHGTVLSIIMQKQFITILSGIQGKDSRIISILDLLNLNDRIYNRNNISDILWKPIDYNKVNQKLEIERQKSINFLKNAIK